MTLLNASTDSDWTMDSDSMFQNYYTNSDMR